VTAEFKDHFSKGSDGYAKHRPTYPDELFRFLSSVTVDHVSAWDCATGNGQAAIALTNYYSNVVASDASQSQINAAIAHPEVDYRVAAAEESGLSDYSQDLVTVGQALHWFDEQAFMAEAGRVLKPDGVLAVWFYELCHVNTECDAIVDTLYRDIVGDYWPPERVTIENGYIDVEMPGELITVPPFEMSLDWSASDMLGFLRTWSACKRYESEKGSDPVMSIAVQLVAAWGPISRRVVWPLQIKASRVNTLLE
jgi:SAM-dependent methyltransferase